MCDRLAGVFRDDGRLAETHGQTGAVIQQDDMDEKDHAGFDHLRVAGPHHRPIHPSRRVGNAQGIAACVKRRTAISGLRYHR